MLVLLITHSYCYCSSITAFLAHFSETLTGLSTVRAYSAQERFQTHNMKKLDISNTTDFCILVSSRWLGVRNEFLGRTIVFFAALFTILAKGNISAGMAGLSLTYALAVTQALNWFVRFATEVESGMNSVERMMYYCEEIPQEAAAVSVDESKRPPHDWPNRGAIEFKNVELKYREDLDTVLKGISAKIDSMESVGILGRTGCGKSTLMNALFRFVELSGGSIEIDGLDISTIGLDELRSKLVIIPQDPVLFSGTIRFNLDPFNQYEDNEIWTALERAHLKDRIDSLGLKLETEVLEFGSNFSVGERQLMCICRAILRKTKILLMDEATSNVDMATDSLIQRTIRSEFRDRTVLTIAHRINTIIDNDKIMVLQAGKVAELDTPKALVQNPSSLLMSLIKETGPASEKFLVKVAMGEVDLMKAIEQQAQAE